MSYEDELCAEIARLKAELADARKVIENLLDEAVPHRAAWEQARAFLARKEAK